MKVTIKNSNSDEWGDHDENTAFQVERPQIKPPPQYKVILLNDDYTPMDFVVEILKKFFAMSLAQATEIMLKVHYHGKGVCGIYTYEIAETKAQQVNAYSRQHQHPLVCTVEEAY